MFSSVLISLILSTFYLVFGWKIYLYLSAGAIFNLGIGSFINLYFGAFYSIPIKLNVKAKAFSLTQLLFTIPKLGLPVLVFFVTDFFIGVYAGWLALMALGLLGVAIRKVVLNHIAKIYRKRKCKNIDAFTKK